MKAEKQEHINWQDMHEVLKVNTSKHSCNLNNSTFWSPILIYLHLYVFLRISSQLVTEPRR